jgi:hypothetical protein
MRLLFPAISLFWARAVLSLSLHQPRQDDGDGGPFGTPGICCSSTGTVGKGGRDDGPGCGGTMVLEITKANKKDGTFATPCCGIGRKLQIWQTVTNEKVARLALWRINAAIVRAAVVEERNTRMITEITFPEEIFGDRYT